MSLVNVPVELFAPGQLTYSHALIIYTQACVSKHTELIVIAAGMYSLMANKPSACVSVPAWGVALRHGQRSGTRAGLGPIVRR